jgi:hypothetical protein
MCWLESLFWLELAALNVLAAIYLAVKWIGVFASA